MLSVVNYLLINVAKGLIKLKWPRYRGNRAGRAVCERNLQRQAEIEVIQRRVFVQYVSLQRRKRTCNLGNCIKIKAELIAERKGSPFAFVHSLYLSNVMSLAPKVDEIRHYASDVKVDLICIHSFIQVFIKIIDTTNV